VLGYLERQVVVQREEKSENCIMEDKSHPYKTTYQKYTKTKHPAEPVI